MIETTREGQLAALFSLLLATHHRHATTHKTTVAAMQSHRAKGLRGRKEADARRKAGGNDDCARIVADLKALGVVVEFQHGNDGPAPGSTPGSAKATAAAFMRYIDLVERGDIAASYAPRRALADAGISVVVLGRDKVLAAVRRS